ncbi:MAG: hypothetical protein KI790_13345 [Cyclobacteriaceae bacterium]|nr:hypothetical protein [Cyclobacteriaceae bacterium HetDA_MAG_MS6]
MISPVTSGLVTKGVKLIPSLQMLLVKDVCLTDRDRYRGDIINIAVDRYLDLNRSLNCFVQFEHYNSITVRFVIALAQQLGERSKEMKHVRLSICDPESGDTLPNLVADLAAKHQYPIDLVPCEEILATFQSFLSQ